jgi:hypothetical protein
MGDLIGSARDQAEPGKYGLKRNDFSEAAFLLTRGFLAGIGWRSGS